MEDALEAIQESIESESRDLSGSEYLELIKELLSDMESRLAALGED